MPKKSEQTREALVETALRLFRERGYEATTMRLIATEAGVSQGNAYYYFEGKEAFVQELYARIQVEHRRAAIPAIQDGGPLADNLRAVWRTGLDVMAPYHAFGSTLLSSALTQAQVSPFSSASTGPRAEAVSLMREVVSASPGVPKGALGEQLPGLLWLAYMGVTLHWVTDSTEGQQRSYTLVDGVAPIISRTLSLTRLPVGRNLANDVVALIGRLTPGGLS